MSTSYTQGTSTTQTEEFGRSVTATASVGIGPLSASVSGTLSETFSTSVTVESARTEMFEKTVTGKAGKAGRTLGHQPIVRSTRFFRNPQKMPKRLVQAD